VKSERGWESEVHGKARGSYLRGVRPRGFNRKRGHQYVTERMGRGEGGEKEKRKKPLKQRIEHVTEYEGKEKIP